MRSCLLGALLGSALLASCATTSFGPGTPAPPTVTTQDLAGGIAYVDTFIVLYRERANSTTNGRQWFEVPAFLGIFGGAVASASGGSDGGLIGAGVASLANAGKTYYAPRTKAGFYRQAFDAMSCVQQVGAGLQAFDASQRALIVSNAGEDQTIYLEMRAAAWGIERILAERLSNTGALPDGAGLAAEFEKLVAERQARGAEAAVLAQTTAAPKFAALANGADSSAIQAEVAVETAARTAALQLHADLQLCVLRMKT